MTTPPHMGYIATCITACKAGGIGIDESMSFAEDTNDTLDAAIWLTDGAILLWNEEDGWIWGTERQGDAHIQNPRNLGEELLPTPERVAAWAAEIAAGGTPGRIRLPPRIRYRDAEEDAGDDLAERLAAYAGDAP